MATTETTREQREAAVAAVFDGSVESTYRVVREWVADGTDSPFIGPMLHRVAEALASHTAAAVERAHNEGRAMGRADVGKYANAIGRIESAVGIVGAVPLGETVAAVERLAAAVERERERIRVMADGIADVAAMDAKRAPNGVTLAACAGRESAARMIADALRSRPPRAGAEATNATREARPRCTTCGDSGWSIDDESNRRRCSCAAAGRGEVGRG